MTQQAGMSELAAVVMALSAAAGALAARPLPAGLAALVILGALAARQTALLCLGVALAASGLAARSWAGLRPAEPRSVGTTVTLVTDPTDVAGALRVDVRLEGKRVEVWARGRAAGRLRSRLAGERVVLSGHLAPIPESERRRVAPRHITARMSAEHVELASAGSWPSAFVNRVRRALLRGAEVLPAERRSLFSGFVLGDDRGQPPEITYDFRASGLTHLLVVSGQNVAFVLAVAAPLLRRLTLRSRMVAGFAVLALFGTLTRWEPSVIRAVAMAGVALLAGTLGRPTSTLRILSLAVAGLLLIDPLLVHSVGFRLSAGACAGIALWSRTLSAALPGPRPVAEALGVTLAAQAGVAPILIPTFGGVPVVSLLANLLALPAAGPVMIWGMAAGFPAGLVGGTIAGVLHIPTRLLLAWVAGVARVAASLPLGQLGLVHLAVLAGAAALFVWSRRSGRPAGARLALAASIAVLLAPAAAVVRPSPADARPVGRGATLWRAGGATVVVLDDARASPDRLLGE
ncbi:MAG: ComEC/Rec2 family competence protein, partial [Actinomycetota bacterium]|nr:ComEC/Rec2 family competence protein [Actinomycetota bacterium]